MITVSVQKIDRLWVFFNAVMHGKDVVGMVNTP